MPIVETPSVLSGISVSKIMRRQVASLPNTANIGQGIRIMIRYKVNAVLLTDNSVPYGVVSKTDLISAYYAELPRETALGDVMGSQPIACFPDDLVEDILEIMVSARVHRLYVIGAHREEVIGTISYADIVGMLFRYCHACERGYTKRHVKQNGIDPSATLTVKEVMTKEVCTSQENDQLFAVIEMLSSRQLGAIIIQKEPQIPSGVISKTDLIISYHHGISPKTEARLIMNTPVYSISTEELLSAAIQQMLVRDVQRLFVYTDELGPEFITGVLALSDSARFRSGSCRACTAGRILIDSLVR